MAQSGSFNISENLLYVFYQGIVASVLCHAVPCWRGGICADDKNQINKLIKKKKKKAVLAISLELLGGVLETRN